MFRPASFHLQWHITERCNLQCQHCYSDPALLKEELPFPELVKILNQYLETIESWGLKQEENRISFTGGEPFIRKDFFSLLQKCYEKKHLTRYGVLTNGVLIDKETASKLRDLRVDYVQVSLEGAEKINDFIRGEGTFKQIVKAIEVLKRAGLPVYISMTVNKINLREVPKVISLGKKLRVDVTAIRGLVPLGRAREIEESFLEPKEAKRLFFYLLREIVERDTRITLGCEDGILAQEMHYLPAGCSAGYGSFSILPNGDVYPCRRLPILCGNLAKQSFKEIYYNSEKLQELRNLDNINKTCQSCPYFHECQGGAKCINYAYFGDSFAPSPQCWRLFNELPSKELRWKGKTKSEGRLDEKWIREG